MSPITLSTVKLIIPGNTMSRKDTADANIMLNRKNPALPLRKYMTREAELLN